MQASTLQGELGFELLRHLHRRAHNPLLVAAGFDTTDVAIPWLGAKRLRVVFG